MKFLTIKFTIVSTIIILISKYLTFLICPALGYDGPWSLSPAFSYMNGSKDQSTFAYEFLGPVFKVHIIDFIYSTWFKIFSLSTYSFINLGFFIIIITISIWLYIAKIVKNQCQCLIYLLILGYVISPYVYGFRPEGLAVFFISLLILSIILNININVKIVLIAIFSIFAGLVHQIGGVIAVLIALYYIGIFKKSTIGILLYVIFGFVIGFIITDFYLIDYLLLPLKLKAELNNHLSTFNFLNIVKYFIYSGPIPLIVIFLFRKSLSNIDIIFMLLIIILLSFFGRSYYVVYLFPIMIFFIGNYNSISEYHINNGSKMFTNIGLLYSILFLFAIPVVLTLISPETNRAVRKTLIVMKGETLKWNQSNRYFVPAPISLETVQNQKARLLYYFMVHNTGIQTTNHTVFYVTSKNQQKWITKGFDILNKRVLIKELVPETLGGIAISSLYKFKILRSESIGLWKITFENK